MGGTTVVPGISTKRGDSPSRSTWGDLATRYGHLGWLERVSLAAFILVTLLLVFVPQVAPHNERDVVGTPLSPPAPGQIMGLDDQGRDVFSRLLIGMRVSWLATMVVIASGVLIGGFIGTVAGMAGGWLDDILMRLTDVFLALPGTLLCLALVSALGPGLGNTLLAVMIVWWPWYSRIVRGAVQSLKARPHVEAAQMGGASWVRVAARHVLPGTIGPVIVTASLDIGGLLLTLVGLSFLGLGSPPPAAELGSMIARGLKFLFTAPWVPVYPAVAVFILAFLGNLAGDAIQDMVEA